MTRPRYSCTTQLAALALITLVVATVLALAGCTSSTPERGNVVSGHLAAQWVDLPDGRVVVCVRSGGDPIRAVTCDWATATREGEN